MNAPEAMDSPGVLVVVLCAYTRMMLVSTTLPVKNSKPSSSIDALGTYWMADGTVPCSLLVEYSLLLVLYPSQIK